MPREALFAVDMGLLEQAGERLRELGDIYWVVGGAGSGKTTLCRHLSLRSGLQLYDMDAHIYGSYHGRFTREHHPINWAWSSSPDALAFLLNMTWEQFNRFNQAALPEYLDLLAEDLARLNPGRVLVDGGIANPALLARRLPTIHFAGLAVEDPVSNAVWEAVPERLEMKEAVYRLPQPEIAWHKFLEFDRRLTENILEECQECGIPLYLRKSGEPPEQSGEHVAAMLGLLI